MTMIDDILAAYDWFDHPDGPKFVETHRDEYRSSGHWLFLPGAFSSFHQVFNNEELWLIHEGRLLVHVLEPAGTHHLLRLGADFAAGERPVVAVPAGYWQAAELPEGTPFAFGTNVCAPSFSFEEFKIARREDLLRDFPDHADLIMRLTRDTQYIQTLSACHSEAIEPALSAVEGPKNPSDSCPKSCVLWLEIRVVA
jgi:predicted cupin superfamily sugar epimerase